MDEPATCPKPRRGRPPKANARHAKNTIHVTLSDLERAAIAEASRVDGKDEAVYVREVALSAARNVVSKGTNLFVAP
jgi:uncharacterized protein (DUF1778 family)